MKQQKDLIVIGGGIMGLFTAYWSSFFSRNVVVIDNKKIGNKYAGSSGYSRSVRNDYLDPFYARLAWESRMLWINLEKQTKTKLVYNCGVLNIAKNDITKSLDNTYAQLTYKTIKSLSFPVKRFATKLSLKKSFPQFDADLGCLDVDAGMIYIPSVYSVLMKILRKRGVKILENCLIKSIEETGSSAVHVIFENSEPLTSRKVVITVGAWTNEFLSKTLDYPRYKIPIIPVKQKVDFFKIPKSKRVMFSGEKMPVFAYLDVGIYGHPLIKNAPGLKVAYFDPGGVNLSKTGFCPEKQKIIKSSRDFINQCIPSLKGARLVKSIFGYYQMTPDGDFVVGKLPGYKNIFLGAGFNGTGYKFAPVIGKGLAESVFRKSTIYDLRRFSPSRFSELSALSVKKTFPSMLKYLKPGNWEYLKIGIKALASNNLP